MFQQLDVNVDTQHLYLKDLNQFNLIIGKNGCGKSRLLRAIRDKYNHDTIVTYVPPERGARFSRSQVEIDALKSTLDYEDDTHGVTLHRRGNEELEFRIRAFEQFLNKTHRRIKYDVSFIEYYLKHINPFLDQIEIGITIRSERSVGIKINRKGTDREINLDAVSSGENELITLWIELLRFLEMEGGAEKNKLLLIDEPDIHLHPDGQYKAAQMLYEIVKEFNMLKRPSKVQMIAVTHSTAILHFFTEKNDVSICFMRPQMDLKFRSLGSNVEKEALVSILPIFGAHPLTQVFNKKPIMLVEGPDDEWIWIQLVRKGCANVYPCPTMGTGKMKQFRIQVEEILSSVYEQPKAFCLRDRDRKIDFEKEENEIKDELMERGIDNPKIKKLVLNCYAVENLCFSDEFLTYWDVRWENLSHLGKFFKRADRGSGIRSKGAEASLMSFLYEREERKRSNGDKSAKFMPWQIAAATVIAQTLKQIKDGEISQVGEHSIIHYLGKEILEDVFQIPRSILDQMSFKALASKESQGGYKQLLWSYCQAHPYLATGAMVLGASAVVGTALRYRR